MSTKKSSKEAEVSTTISKPRRVSHKGARAKGLQFEREIAQLLGHIFPEAERQLESQASSCNGIDLQGTDIIAIQCKNHAGYCSVSTIKEIHLKDPSHIPVLVTKGIRQAPMAVLPFEKFVTLLEIAYGHSPRLVNPYSKASVEPGKLTHYLPKKGEIEGARLQIVEAEVVISTPKLEPLKLQLLVPLTQDCSGLLDSFL